MKKYIILLITLIAFCIAGEAQSKNMLHHKAGREFEKMRYAYAIPLYHSYLKKGGSDSTALLYLAVSYAKLNQYDSAIVYFEKANQFGLEFRNYLPELYAIKGDYVNAKKWYNSLKEANRTLLIDARLYGFEHLIDFLSDSLDYNLQGLKLNTTYNDFGATPYNGGLVFESNRKLQLNKKNNKKHISGWDGKNYSQLYFNNGMDSNVVLFSPGFNGKLNVGSISFTKDGLVAYYTKNANKKSKSGVYQLEIWESSFKEGGWSKGRKMFFNNPNFSYFHPFITPDGNRLYYVSDDSTGMGGTDIYYIDKNEDGAWKSTQNAGVDVNTQGNELFPTFYANSLYFSSNGHPGLGGLDIYKLSKSKLRLGDWEVQNMGYPINSSKDDFSFSVLEGKGYISSNRGGNDDIFSFNYKIAVVDIQGKVAIDSNLICSNVLYYSYKTTDGVEHLDSAIIDSKGNYTFKARANKNYTLYVVDNIGAKHPFQINTNQFSAKNDMYTQINSPLVVTPLEDQLKLMKEKQEAIKLADLAGMTKKFRRAIDSLSTMTKEVVVLHHPFDQVYVVKEDLEAYYGLIEKVKKMKGKKIVIVSAADCTGDEAYNDDLSKRRANRIYKTFSHLSDNEVVTKSVGEMELLNDCNDINNQQKNRYSYVFIVNK